MSEQNHSWEKLNAYVDGELSPPEAADMAAAAAHDPQLAQAIATLTRLKAATHSDLVGKSKDAPSLQAKSPGRVRRASGWKWPFALAASLVIAVLVGTAVWRELPPPENSRVWITAAQEQHQEWLASATEVTHESRSALYDASGAQDLPLEISINGVTGYAPDLSPTGMRITRFSSFPSENGEGFFVGYRGENGCQLSLTIGPAPDALDNALSVTWDGDKRATAHWRVGETAYAAVAHKMDHRRFEKLTAYLEQVTREAGPQQEVLRTARNTENESRPCLA